MSPFNAPCPLRQATKAWWPLLLGVLIGSTLGSTFALLFTPRSGRDTRHLAQTLPAQMQADWQNPYSPTRQLVSKRQAQWEFALDTLKQRRKARRMARAKRREEAASSHEA
jgi:gas vesicle protein